MALRFATDLDSSALDSLAQRQSCRWPAGTPFKLQPYRLRFQWKPSNQGGAAMNLCKCPRGQGCASHPACVGNIPSPHLESWVVLYHSSTPRLGVVYSYDPLLCSKRGVLLVYSCRGCYIAGCYVEHAITATMCYIACKNCYIARSAI